MDVPGLFISILYSPVSWMALWSFKVKMLQFAVL
jgi:hypothetical protein